MKGGQSPKSVNSNNEGTTKETDRAENIDWEVEEMIKLRKELGIELENEDEQILQLLAFTCGAADGGVQLMELKTWSAAPDLINANDAGGYGGCDGGEEENESSHHSVSHYVAGVEDGECLLV
ncbi:hypothetical protein L1987_86906 [Smallanthus sonchifolius]|uniref:Uncharacterized protein n=1 Tax=Smallanthus sonchifolius TaxID=185202 RepID=A0ACB8Y1G4_9ASTR|nr:hypothetical protein L1987_86906 [Smallanthus sonchifolius]